MAFEGKLTELIELVDRGDREAAERLLPLVYSELRQLAAQKLAHERAGHTLQPTALVHEAYLRMMDGSKLQPVKSRSYFFAAAAEAMRRILIENAREKQTQKRGGHLDRKPLNDLDCLSAEPPEELLALDIALNRLAEKDEQKAKLVELRYFAGLTMSQAAELLGISVATAERYWAYARAWLRRDVENETEEGQISKNN